MNNCIIRSVKVNVSGTVNEEWVALKNYRSIIEDVYSIKLISVQHFINHQNN
jgi:hypothetical protein